MLSAARARISSLLGEVLRAVGLIIHIVIVMQRSAAHSAAEVLRMIRLAESLSHLAGDGLIAFGADGASEVRVVSIAVGTAVVLVEAVVGELAVASSADKVLRVVLMSHCRGDLADNGPAARVALGRVTVLPARITRAILVAEVIERVGAERLMTISAREALVMPRLAMQRDKVSGDAAVTAVALIALLDAAEILASRRGFMSRSVMVLLVVV